MEEGYWRLWGRNSNRGKLLAPLVHIHRYIGESKAKGSILCHTYYRMAGWNLEVGCTLVAFYTIQLKVEEMSKPELI